MRLLWPLALLACASLQQTTPVADVRSQLLFDEAITWSREAQLETAGCFDVYTLGRTTVVANAVERVFWRRAHATNFACNRGQGIWHTHWLPESDSTVGCNLERAYDRGTLGPHHPVGVVICGVGRDSLRLYAWDTTMARAMRGARKRGAQVAPPLTDTLPKTCDTEPVASRVRGRLTCTPP